MRLCPYENCGFYPCPIRGWWPIQAFLFGLSGVRNCWPRIYTDLRGSRRSRKPQRLKPTLSLFGNAGLEGLLHPTSPTVPIWWPIQAVFSLGGVRTCWPQINTDCTDQGGAENLSG